MTSRMYCWTCSGVPPFVNRYVFLNTAMPSVPSLTRYASLTRSSSTASSATGMAGGCFFQRAIRRLSEAARRSTSLTTLAIPPRYHKRAHAPILLAET